MHLRSGFVYVPLIRVTVSKKRPESKTPKKSKPKTSSSKKPLKTPKPKTASKKSKKQKKSSQKKHGDFSAAHLMSEIPQSGELQFWSKSRLNVGKYLSNFQASRIPFDGYVFPSIEHAYQAQKMKYARKIASKKTAYKPLTVADFAEGGSIGKLSGVEAKKAIGKVALAKRGIEIDAKFHPTRLGLMKKLVKIRFDNDKLYHDIITTAVKRGVKLVHYDKTRGPPGKRSTPFWGAFRPQGTKELFGEDQLGKMMTRLVK